MDPSKDRPPTVGNLNTDDWKRFEEIADRFEQAWRQASPGDRVEIAAFLPPPDNPLRPGVLHELIKIELEVRCRRGQAVRLEEYADRFPELGPAARLPASLVYEEYRVRQVYGDKPEVAAYRARFPERFAELERLVASQPLPTLTQNQQTPAATSADGEHGAHKPATLAAATVGTLGEYKLVKRIGTGGFGEVWRAEAPGGVEVAVKIIFRPLDHEEAQRELQSLELVKRLRHPFLLQTQAFYQHDDKLRIVMELADASLRDRLKECRKEGRAGIPLAELLTYFREAAEALDYLHGEHVLHRDIKPENILLLKRHAKVADFGLARLQQNTRSVSASGSGTPAYMAPEVWRGKVSVHSDQYSLAAAYVELRLDRRPFAAGDMMELMFGHLERGPDLTGLPEPERQVILRALAKDPNQRYGSCSEFVQALERAAVGGTSGTAATEPDQTPAAGNARAVSDPGWETLGKGGLPSEVAAARSGSVTDVEPGTAPDAKPAPNWRGGAETLPRPGVAPAKRPSRRRFLAAVALLGVGLPVGGVVAYRLWKNGPDNGTGQSRGGDGPQARQADYVPPGFVPAAGAELVDDRGRKLYSRIDYTTPEGTRVRFVLIPKQGERDPATFYIMENKVWVGLFREFVKAHPDGNRNKGWADKDPDPDMAWLNQEPRLPVFNIPALDAYDCAQWLQGNLPTPTEWDKAAGAFDESTRQGPFRGTWGPARKLDIAVNRGRAVARPVGDAKDDISKFGCHDMAGNGREWTRDYLTTNLTGRSLPDIVPMGLVILRGRSWAAPTPLLFKELRENDQRSLEGADPTRASPFTSFRVVLELPQ